ncbi:hypothetical protein MPDQ_000210 [Monascus purpureus]|uniref:Uncharacterized protein n=1 Tax=Monascus purpureus TaxID=5098 RepID=A0A507R1H5_MONPU|nr:hypothetical protein MPDQ_000210 [Monascus purpureus]BDD59260.1 hypothetical protein MAP00_004481 [Monascus purpureus]
MLSQDNGQHFVPDPSGFTLVTPPAAYILPPLYSSNHYGHRDLQLESTIPSEEPKPRISDSSRTASRQHWSVGLPRIEPDLAPNEPKNGSILTPTSSSSGAPRKEARIQNSRPARSSYMPEDSVSHSALRMDERSSHGSQSALLLLFRLSIPVPLFSLVSCLYTIMSLFFVLLVSPLRICSLTSCFKSTSFSAQLCDLLAPVLHVHERLVCAQIPPSRRSSTQRINDNSNESIPSGSSKYYSIPWLILVLSLSSFLSIGLVLTAWTAAFFWLFAMILGNPEPDSAEREKDDGRAAVLGVSNWWVKWLRKARKRPQ